MFVPQALDYQEAKPRSRQARNVTTLSSTYGHNGRGEGTEEDVDKES